MTKHLITAALPYANGPIHIGHVVEYVQADIYARYMRSRGEDIIYVCADDTHGTPIELRAIREGITPQELIARSYEEHKRDFEKLDVSFDVFYTTNSPENRELAGQVFAALRDGGHVTRIAAEQWYSEALERFLPDRFVKGTCPNCGAKDQYSDACEVCNKTYKPTELLDPYDVIEKKTPIRKETENLYVRLADFGDFLAQWLPEHVPQDGPRAQVMDWVERGLADWCISRDAPYFGFEIPGEPGKYFYVWLDAPIGYIAATKKYCDDNGLDFLAEYWAADADSRIVHVIGKDIIYFHALFWPAMLKAAGFRQPAEVHVHGFLTLNGEKMSKSKGTLISASTYLEHLDAEYLRYYVATKLSDAVDDLDLSLDDFTNRVNGELVNNVVNLANRVLKFLASRFDGDPGTFDKNHELVGQIAEHVERVHSHYGSWNYAAATRTIGELGSLVNTFFQDSAPWAQFKEDPEAAHATCALALHGACALVACLIPVTPSLVARFAACLGIGELGWEHASVDFRPEKVEVVGRLLDRVDRKIVQTMYDQSVAEAKAAAEALRDDVVAVEEFGDQIVYDDFAKLDLRVGVVDSAETVEKADKLLKLTVNCGKPVTVFAGVRSAYPDPSVLVGKRVIVVANLKPRKMRFGVSEGMLLAVSDENDDVAELVTLSDGLKGGWTVS